MRVSTALVRSLRWINLPGAVLLALLQRTPAVRVAAVAEELAVRSPLGAVLRSAVATAAALGAVHSLAGATRIVATQGTTTTNSINVTVGTAITPVVFVTTGAPTIALSYIITGLPPGLTVAGLNATTNILNVANPQGTGQITGTPTTAGSYSVSIQAWEFANAKGSFSVPITILVTVSPAGASGPPTITTQPMSLVSAVGESATLTVGVTANPAATFQWYRNGVTMAGAIGASYTVGNVSLNDAGNYTVNVTNSFGTVTSAAATLTVNATSSSPVFTTQPASQTLTAGATVVFTAVASGAPTPTYQWLRSSTTPGAGAPVLISGATKSTLVLTGAEAIVGNYSVIATNSVNAVTSKPATLSVIATSNPGYLKNLSVLTRITSTEASFTVGTIIDAGTGGASKPLLVRAAGPSLSPRPFLVPDTLPDPQLTFYQRQSVFSANLNWSTVPGLAAIFTTAGAFSFTSQLDAAVYEEKTPAGEYTVVVTGAVGQTGNVLAEIYDATPGVAVAATAPRLINLSVLKRIPAADLLTAGFVIQGDTSLTVLIRAIGPGLVPVVNGNIPTAALLADPQLEVFDLNVTPSASLARNDNWGGDSQLLSVNATAHPFPLTDTGSTDAVLLLTLRPGSYSAQASGVKGGDGTAIVEVYEVR